MRLSDRKTQYLNMVSTITGTVAINREIRLRFAATPKWFAMLSSKTSQPWGEWKPRETSVTKIMINALALSLRPVTILSIKDFKTAISCLLISSTRAKLNRAIKSAKTLLTELLLFSRNSSASSAAFSLTRSSSSSSEMGGAELINSSNSRLSLKFSSSSSASSFHSLFRKTWVSFRPLISSTIGRTKKNLDTC